MRAGSTVTSTRAGPTLTVVAYGPRGLGGRRRVARQRAGGGDRGEAERELGLQRAPQQHAGAAGRVRSAAALRSAGSVLLAVDAPRATMPSAITILISTRAAEGGVEQRAEAADLDDPLDDAGEQQRPAARGRRARRSGRRRRPAAACAARGRAPRWRCAARARARRSRRARRSSRARGGCSRAAGSRPATGRWCGRRARAAARARRAGRRARRAARRERRGGRAGAWRAAPPRGRATSAGLPAGPARGWSGAGERAAAPDEQPGERAEAPGAAEAGAEHLARRRPACAAAQNVPPWPTAPCRISAASAERKPATAAIASRRSSRAVNGREATRVGRQQAKKKISAPRPRAIAPYWKPRATPARCW